jgi:UDP-N-acetylmuramoyl-tripeptide--D-alanyl-D-alanine ligase
MFKDTHFIGITASSGKTTTKDLAEKVLASRFQTHKNTDTNNSLYSIAHTILRSPMGTEVCIQEIGASELEDLNKLVQLLRPNIGVVTNIGKEHYKAFRSREAVAHEKAKLIAALPVNGVAILNADDQLVRDMAKLAKCRVITFGLGEKCELRAEQVRSDWPQRLATTIGNDPNL